MKFSQIVFTLILSVIAFQGNAQTDFNYTFYPVGKYAKVGQTNVLDTVKQSYSLKTDTVAKAAIVIVEKQNSRFSIRTLGNISETLYDLNVRFVGLTKDGDMQYKALTDTGEILEVNPIKGSVKITFQKCFSPEQGQKAGDRKLLCDITSFYFGNIAPGNIK
jgi:hypothetical protein